MTNCVIYFEKICKGHYSDDIISTITSVHQFIKDAHYVFYTPRLITEENNIDSVERVMDYIESIGCPYTCIATPDYVKKYTPDHGFDELLIFDQKDLFQLIEMIPDNDGYTLFMKAGDQLLMPPDVKSKDDELYINNFVLDLSGTYLKTDDLKESYLSCFYPGYISPFSIKFFILTFCKFDMLVIANKTLSGKCDADLFNIIRFYTYIKDNMYDKLKHNDQFEVLRSLSWSGKN